MLEEASITYRVEDQDRFITGHKGRWRVREEGTFTGYYQIEAAHLGTVLRLHFAGFERF